MYMSPEMFRGEQYTEKVWRGVGAWSSSVGERGAREMGGGKMRVWEAGCQGRQELGKRVVEARAGHLVGKGKADIRRYGSGTSAWMRCVGG